MAQAAASEGFIAGARTGSTGVASSTATSYAASAGEGVLVGTGVATNRSGDTITVTVTGNSIPIIPGVPTPAVRATVSGAVETTHP